MAASPSAREAPRAAMPQISPQGPMPRPWTPSVKRMRSWTTAHPPGLPAPGRRELERTTTNSPMMKTQGQKKQTTPHLFSIKMQRKALRPSGCWPSLASSMKSSWIRRSRPTQGCAPVTARPTAPPTPPWRRPKVTTAWSPARLNWSWRGWWRREASSPAAWVAYRTQRWRECPSAPRLRPRPAWWPAAQMKDGRPVGWATSTALPATPPLITTQAAHLTPTPTTASSSSSKLTSQAHRPPPPPPASTTRQLSSSPPAAAALPTPRLPPSTTRTCAPSAWEMRGRVSSKEPHVFVILRRVV